MFNCRLSGWNVCNGGSLTIFPRMTNLLIIFAGPSKCHFHDQWTMHLLPCHWPSGSFGDIVFKDWTWNMSPACKWNLHMHFLLYHYVYWSNWSFVFKIGRSWPINLDCHLQTSISILFENLDINWYLTINFCMYITKINRHNIWIRNQRRYYEIG